jgi:D-alanyl-D-alanine endopeptidase (penicillin-binding protein 7)
MLQFARRLWGALLLSALLAGSITTIADSAPVKTGRPVYRQAAAARTATRATHRRRRARRAPPGGVVWARNAIVLDPATGEVLFEKNSDSSVPIASLSKLMTMMVFLEQKPDLDRKAEVTREEITGGGHTQLRNGEQVTLRDLLHMGLMCSDNVATRVLARESGLAPEDFLARMNHKAIELGMTHTRFVEFTGLDERNVSTAADVARMLHAAADIDLVREITTTRSYAFRTQRRSHLISNTNRLLFSRYEILGGKTGFINEAGYCFATWLHTQGRDLIAVVLGAPTNATRFADTVRLVQRTTTASIAQP